MSDLNGGNDNVDGYHLLNKLHHYPWLEPVNLLKRLCSYAKIFSLIRIDIDYKEFCIKDSLSLDIYYFVGTIKS